ncbi:MAG: MFS transporter [Candidatus Methylomirabilia bacterium]
MFTLSSAAAGAAPTLEFLIFARILQGLGGGSLIPLSQAIMVETFEPEERGMVMGYTPLLAGLILAPGGAATMITMPLAGVLVNRIDPRWILGTGAALAALAMSMMAGLTLEANFWQIMWPRFIQGLGIGFMFVPLTTVTLSAVRRAEVGHAAGIYNVMRNLGGSVGIAAMSSFLERGAQIHQARLVTHVSLYDPETWQRAQSLTTRFMTRGADLASAQQQAWGALYATVQKQALFQVSSRCVS